jgi:XTP/dITP diphosphohydrolase
MTSSPAPGSRFIDLVAVLDQLRSPGGCPWDARQTHQSLVEYLVEEAYETVETIENDDAIGLREELGDLLLQVVFHARIAAESETHAFDIDAVSDGIITKLISRHPHVFGDVTADTAEQVEANWHALKAKEKNRESVTDGIPASLPALTRASKVIARSATVHEQLPELPMNASAHAAIQELGSEADLGELLFALVAAARDRGWDAEAALRQAVRDHVDVIRAVEASPHG